MDSFNFYKSLYERELKRRHDLEGGISPFLTVLSAIVAILYYFNKEETFSFCSVKTAGPNTVLIFTIICFFVCLHRFCLAYNNLFAGFNYKNIAYPSELRKMEYLLEQDEIDYKDHNDSQLISKKTNFENGIINNLIEVTDINKQFNDTRGDNFFKSRSLLILTFILTIFQIIILLIFKNWL